MCGRGGRKAPFFKADQKAAGGGNLGGRDLRRLKIIMEEVLALLLGSFLCSLLFSFFMPSFFVIGCASDDSYRVEVEPRLVNSRSPPVYLRRSKPPSPPPNKKIRKRGGERHIRRTMITMMTTENS